MSREENIQKVAKIISEAIEAKREVGVSMSSIAQRAGVSKTRLSRIARGQEGLPRPVFLQRIAPYLGVSYTELMDAAGYLPPKLELTDDEPLPPELQAEWDELLKDMKLIFRKHLQGDLTPREIRSIIRAIRSMAHDEDPPR